MDGSSNHRLPRPVPIGPKGHVLGTPRRGLIGRTAPRHHQPTDPIGARLAKGGACRIQRGPGGDDVIDDQDRPPDRYRSPKGRTVEPGGPVPAGLGRSPTPNQQLAARKAELSCHGAGQDPAVVQAPVPPALSAGGNPRHLVPAVGLRGNGCSKPLPQADKNVPPTAVLGRQDKTGHGLVIAIQRPHGTKTGQAGDDTDRLGGGQAAGTNPTPRPSTLRTPPTEQHRSNTTNEL